MAEDESQPVEIRVWDERRGQRKRNREREQRQHTWPLSMPQGKLSQLHTHTTIGMIICFKVLYTLHYDFIPLKTLSSPISIENEPNLSHEYQSIEKINSEFLYASDHNYLAHLVISKESCY